MLDHLRDQGAGSIALITGPEMNSYTLDTRNAYKDWVEEQGAEPRSYIAGSGLSGEAGYETTAKMFADGWPPMRYMPRLTASHWVRFTPSGTIGCRFQRIFCSPASATASQLDLPAHP